MRINMHQPPEPGSFVRVMRRTDRHLGLAANARVQSATHNLRCRAIEHPDGVKALTIFVTDHHAVDAFVVRQRRLGWTDVTELWADYKGAPPADPEDVDALAALSWPDLTALADAHDIRTSGVKRAVVEQKLAEKLGLAQAA